MGVIASFFGAQPRCGLSQTVLSLAMYLAEQGAATLLVHLEDKPGDEYTPGLSESMERLRPFLRDGLWDLEEVYGKAFYSGNLSVIGGAGRPASSGLYYPEDTASFLRAVSERWEFILCDCGSDICHGLSLGGMQAADKRFIVLNQNENCLKRYEWQRELLKKLDADTGTYVVCMERKDSLYDRAYISKRLSAEKLIGIGVSQKGESAEVYGRALLSFRDRKYEEDIRNISQEVRCPSI